MIHRVLYRSEAASSSSISMLSLAHILGVSDRNNRRDRITGLLVVHRVRFLQVMEGPRLEIDRLMARLENDPRHRDMRVLSDASAMERRYPLWSMTRGPTTPELAALLDADDAQCPNADRYLSLLEAAAAQLTEQAA